MGSYENIVKIEEMRKKVDEGDLLSAQKVLDTMDIKKLKNLTDLNLIAEIYTKNEKYEEAIALCLKIYEKLKSRKSLFQLIEVFIKSNNVEDAERYLEQYQKLAPKDFYNYVFRYKINKIKGDSFEQLIKVLENLKKIEYTEKWAYELAKLYYKAGMEEACIRECSDLELWFGDGTYVEKARILKSYYAGGTNKDQFMEEIKRRSEVINTKSEDQEQPQEQDEQQYENEYGNDYENKDLAEYEDSEDESASEERASYTGVRDPYLKTDFMVNEVDVDFTDVLKKDIQNIMTDELEADNSCEEGDYNSEACTTYRADNTATYWEEKTYYEGLAVAEEDILAFSAAEADARIQSTKDTDAIILSEVAAVIQPAEDTTIKLPSEETVYEEELEKPMMPKIISVKQAPSQDRFDEDDLRLRELVKEYQINQEEIFGNFLHVTLIKKQIVKCLEGVLSERSKNPMMMIIGTVGSGKTTLAKDMALFFFMIGKLKSSKVAKIKADKLNSLNILEKKDTLMDCCLVVENASELKRKTIDSLLDLNTSMQGNMVMVFEEDKKNMNKLFREYPKLMDMLKNRIYLPQYTQEDLLGFAYACLRQKDYRLNPRAEQLLRTKTSLIMKQFEPHRHLEQINELMQKAMNTADIRMGKQLTSLASQGRLRDVDVLMVLAEDFK